MRTGKGKTARGGFRWALFGAYAVFITAVSLMTLPETEAAGWPGADKVVHAGLYAAYAGLLLYALPRHPARPVLAPAAALGAALLHGAVLEALQPILNPGRRTGDPMDLAANAAGALAMVALAALRKRDPAAPLIEETVSA